MMLMSCKRAEKLMQLYAAGDLPPGRRKRAVAAHVGRCASCAALSEEFRASREWVRAAGEVPEFGDDFYERLRAGVLDRVNRDTRPAAPERFAPLFAATFARPRLAYAASLALAGCALALAFYVFSGAGKSQKDQALVGTTPRGEASRPTPELSPSPPDVATQERQLRPRPADETAGGGFKRTPSLRRRATPRDATRASESAATVVTPPAQQGGERGVVPVAPRAETAGVARIELQTADPNIRIIWLAPDTGEETEPERVDPER